MIFIDVCPTNLLDLLAGQGKIFIEISITDILQLGKK